MKRVHASELAGGDDHEFLVRLYTHLLDRWPDRAGYSHYLGRIDGRPEERPAVIRAVMASDEARKLQVEVVFDEPEPAIAGAPESAGATPAGRPYFAPPPSPAPGMGPAGGGMPGGPMGAPLAPQPQPLAASPFAPPPALPSFPMAAAAAQPVAPPADRAAIVSLTAELAALRAHVALLEAEIAALRVRPDGGTSPMAEAAVPPNLLDDVSQQVNAMFTLGLATLEARLAALERNQPHS